jgi:aminopeptidase Y
MAHRTAIAALALAGISSAGQLPLQAPLDVPSVSDSPVSDNGIFDLPLVDSEALQARISSTSLGKHANALYEIAKRSEDEYGHPTRVIGSEGHKGTLKYITDSLSKLGSYYNVSTQDFPAVTGNVFQSRLVVGAEVPKHVAAMSLTPATKNREPVHGDLVLVSNVGCEASDYPAEAEGNIVLIKRGECSFGDKSIQAGKAGAIAAVVYNTDPEVLHGTLGTPSPDHVATFGLGGEEGEKYAKQLKDGKTLDTIAYIDAIVETIKTTNILAQTTAGDPDNCVMLGGHSDSVEEGPGIK